MYLRWKDIIILNILYLLDNVQRETNINHQSVNQSEFIHINKYIQSVIVDN